MARKWYVLDAAGKPMGKTAAPRLICFAASSRPTTPRMLTTATTSSSSTPRTPSSPARSWSRSNYRTHSGYPGGLKETQYKTLMEKKPDLAMRLAVRGMLQKNTIAQWQLKRLRIFAGSEHTHAAQKPEVWDF